MRRLGRVQPPGTEYNIAGFQSHLNCSGAGSPTLLLEAGLGDDFLSWRRVQPALSQVTRVCSYDRAGYGWSDARPGPRDTNHVAQELHSLLLAAKIQGPLVMMGHSAGGLFIRKYTSLYPENIVALVFVDASTPTQFERLPVEFRGVENFTWDKLGLPFGLTRLRGNCGVPDEKTPEVRQLLQWHDCRESVYTATEREEIDFPSSAAEAKGTGPYGDMPILIFSQDPALHFGDVPYPLHTAQTGAATWNDLQEGLKQLSSRSQRIIARGSTHYIQLLRPELVTEHVRHLILELRGAEPRPQDYGSTVTE